jgi:hypothetical protein
MTVLQASDGRWDKKSTTKVQSNIGEERKEEKGTRSFADSKKRIYNLSLCLPAIYNHRMLNMIK